MGHSNPLQMVENIKEVGILAYLRVRAKSPGPMGPNLKDGSQKENAMGLELYHIAMVLYILASFLMVIFMEKVSSNGLMVKYTSVLD